MKLNGLFPFFFGQRSWTFQFTFWSQISNFLSIHISYRKGIIFHHSKRSLHYFPFLWTPKESPETRKWSNISLFYCSLIHRNPINLLLSSFKVLHSHSIFQFFFLLRLSVSLILLRLLQIIFPRKDGGIFISVIATRK